MVSWMRVGRSESIGWRVCGWRGRGYLIVLWRLCYGLCVCGWLRCESSVLYRIYLF